MPLKWWYTLVGGLLGGLLTAVIYQLFQAPWLELVGFALVFAGLVIGRFIGAAMGWRSDGWIDHH